MNTEIHYNLEKFEGYTHRHVLEVHTTTDEYPLTLHLYANTGDREALTETLKAKKPEKVTSFRISHTFTTEHDENVDKLLEELDNQKK